MADETPISALPEAVSVNGGDLLLVIQDGVAKKATAEVFVTGKQDSAAILDALIGLSDNGAIERTGSSSLGTFTVTTAAKGLLDDDNVSAMRTTLGLGTAAVLDVPASGNAASGEVVKGSDTRLTNSRVPTTHTHVLADITNAGTAASKNYPASGNAAAGEVVLGADTRLTGARTPTSHKTSHAVGGTDVLSPSDIGASAIGHTHLTTDITGLGTSAVLNVAGSGDAASGEVVKGSDTRLSDSRTPTSHTHTVSAITDAGTAAALNVPSTGNATSGQVVLGSDTRLTNARTPSAHKTSHQTGGTDAIAPSDIGAAATSHTHTVSQITDAGTAATKSYPASGDATSGQVVLGSDSRLTNARTPSTHKSSHATGGTDALIPSDIGAASTTHASTHQTGGTDELTPADIGAAEDSHTHTLSQITDAGDIASQDAASVAITGGTIAGVTVDATTIDGTVITASTSVKLESGSYAVTLTPTTLSANRAITFPNQAGELYIDTGENVLIDTSTVVVDTTLARYHTLTMTASHTFNFTGHTAGRRFFLKLKQDATGSRLATWDSEVRWTAGTPPTLTTTASRSDLIEFFDTGTRYLGSVVAQNFDEA